MLYELFGATVIAGGTHFGPTAVNYIRHLARSGIDLSGDWKIDPAEVPEDGGTLTKKWTTDISLKQVGKKISGKAVANAINHDSRPINYKIDGSFENGYLDISFRDTERSRFSVSLFLLKLQSNGAILAGHRCFNGAIEDRSRVAECTWRRPGEWAEDLGCEKVVA